MKHRIITVIAGLGVATLAACSAPVDAQPVAETVNTTKTVTPAPVTKTVAKTDPRIEACWGALDEGRDAMLITSDTLGIFTELIDLMPEAIDAAAQWDSARLDELTTKVLNINDRIAANTDKLDGNRFAELAEKCEQGR